MSKGNRTQCKCFKLTVYSLKNIRFSKPRNDNACFKVLMQYQMYTLMFGSEVCYSISETQNLNVFSGNLSGLLYSACITGQVYSFGTAVKARTH